MKRRAWVIIVVVGALALPAAGAAAKGKPQPQPKVTCADWVANGAVWLLDFDGDYRVDGLPACIDLREEHSGPVHWTVAWHSDLSTPIKGVVLRFEVMGAAGRTVLAEHLVQTASGSWDFGVLDPDEPGFKFVAMPHRRDRWASFSVVLTPGP